MAEYHKWAIFVHSFELVFDDSYFHFVERVHPFKSRGRIICTGKHNKLNSRVSQLCTYRVFAMVVFFISVVDAFLNHYEIRRCKTFTITLGFSLCLLKKFNEIIIAPIPFQHGLFLAFTR